MITLKSPREIGRMRHSGAIVAEVLERVRRFIEPGMTTEQIDRYTTELTGSFDSARPAFLGYRGFPKSICISINEQVVHGIPSGEKIIQAGDLVSLDFGVSKDGYYADSAISFQVPPLEPEVSKFLDVCRNALSAGIENALPGNRIGDISWAIQNTVESQGYFVVKSLVGHGIGKNLHEEPQIPNFGNPGEGVLLQEGMVLAIEPMINMGTSEVRTLEDDWTIVTVDGSLSAHFEHTIVVNEGVPSILTMVNERIGTN